MAYTIEHTKNELEKRFAENGWNKLELTMRNGITINVTPCWYGDVPPAKASECEWFLLDCAEVNLNGDERIEKVAETLNNFEDILQSSNQEKIQCQKFYQDHIEGHSKEERLLGHQVYDQLWNKGYEENQSAFNDEFCDAHLPAIAENLGVSVETAKKALKLSFDLNWYSDWHKDLYGFRPR